jgi:hypothetical protein
VELKFWKIQRGVEVYWHARINDNLVHSLWTQIWPAPYEQLNEHCPFDFHSHSRIEVPGAYHHECCDHWEGGCWSVCRFLKPDLCGDPMFDPRTDDHAIWRYLATFGVRGELIDGS